MHYMCVVVVVGARRSVDHESATIKCKKYLSSVWAVV